MHRIDFASVAWTHPQLGARYKRWTSAGKVIRILELQQEFVEPDWCEKAHVGLVLEGTVEIDFRGAVERFSAGDGLVIPAGDGHKARAVTKSARLVLFEEEELK